MTSHNKSNNHVVIKKRKSKTESLTQRSKVIKPDVPWAPGFKPLKERDIKRAIGMERTNDNIQKEYHPSIHFTDIPHPMSNTDWLSIVNEDGQSFYQFAGTSPWLQKPKVKGYSGKYIASCGGTILEKYPDGKIYLLHLVTSNFNETDGSRLDLESMRNFLEIYYQLPVVILPEAVLNYDANKQKMHIQGSLIQGTPIEDFEPTFRRSIDTKKFQLRIDTGLLGLKVLMPIDGLFMVTITMSDLYADKTDLFTVGTGSAKHNFGIFSFLRYDPGFVQNSEEDWHDYDFCQAEKQCSNDNVTAQGSSKFNKAHSTERDSNLLLQRCCKTLVHEVGHLLGIKHCIYFSCTMNESGHLEEDFRQPIHLCPVDLHKVQLLSGVDIVERYLQLAKFYKDHVMENENSWIKSRIDYIS